jgi:quinol monooxygenase YgiN
VAIESLQIYTGLKRNRHESGEGGRFYFYELWDSQAALEQHAASPHCKHLELIVGDLSEVPFEVNILKEVLNLRSGT